MGGTLCSTPICNPAGYLPGIISGAMRGELKDWAGTVAS